MHRIHCAVAVAALAVAAQSVQAASQRTFVSTSGADNVNCSLAQPCRTFGAAITAANPGGEVIVLDSGGYGAVAIAKEISIIAPPGVYAGISVFSGHGIAITAAGVQVKLAGLTINNQGTSGHGVSFTGSGTLHLERMHISGFNGTGQAGVSMAPSATSRLEATDVAVKDNQSGFAVSGGSTASLSVTAVLDRVEASGCGVGVNLNDTIFATIGNSLITTSTASGVQTFAASVTSKILLTIDHSRITANGLHGVYPGDDAGTTFVAITASTIDSNAGAGLRAGTNSTTYLNGNTFTLNAYGIHPSSTGLVASIANNMIYGNGISDGPAPGTLPGR
jgi:hypothetical protein